MIYLLIALMAGCLSVVITKLTEIGDKIGFKPFNCFICLAFWTGFIASYMQDFSFINAVLSLGTGFVASVVAYFIVDHIFRPRP